MPSPPPDPVPGLTFMEDFYAECDEHLAAIRHGLVRLDQQVGEIPDLPLLEKIYRSLHSLKGICGLARLGSAEQLAHTAEDYLRALTRREAMLTDSGVDVLTGVVQTLEELVVSHRQRQAPPQVDALIEQTKALLPSAEQKSPPAPTQAAPPAGAPPPPAASPDRKLWKCAFKPSPELDRRGIKINSVRAQLQELGEILQGTPVVQPGGELLFEFILAAPSERVEKWSAEGIQVTALESLPPAASGSRGARSGSGTSPAAAGVAPSHFVRVDLSRLDELMRLMGDLVVQRARLEEALGHASDQLAAKESRRLQDIVHGFGRDLRHLRGGLMRLRMVPIGEVFDRLPFVVRDLSREQAKSVRLNLQGQHTELDKYLVERLRDPLLHLVRNAVAHGIEPPAERAAQGKPAEGTLTLQAYTVAETVVVEVTDDGRGIDPAMLRAPARAAGVPLSDTPNAAEILELLCTPGFSTRERADLGAGRGMGMAAVRTTLQDLTGELELESTPKRGTTFRLRLPLTLAVADALIVAAGGQRFAMPQSAVQEITTAESQAIHRLEQNEIVRHRDRVLPLIRLASLFGLGAEPRSAYPVLVVGTGLSAVGIVADRVLGQREIVMRPVRDPLLRVPGITGATELGDGQAVLVLDSTALTQVAKARQRLAQRNSQRWAYDTSAQPG